MRKKPRFEIGGGAFILGSIRDIVRAAGAERAELQRTAGEIRIVGIPTEWLQATKTLGAFSNPKNNILEAFIRGTASRTTPPYDFKMEGGREYRVKFDLDKKLADENLAQFKDGIRLRGREGEVFEFRYNSNKMAPINITEMRILSRLHRVSDTVIHYILVQEGLDGTQFLWAKFSRHKDPATKEWDAWAKAINKVNREVYGKYKICGSLDLVAIHDDEDWMMDRYKARNAILNAYQPEVIKKKLLPMVKGTKAELVISERTGGALVPRSAIKVKPLFKP